jgi:hypothetical protein
MFLITFLNAPFKRLYWDQLLKQYQALLISFEALNTHKRNNSLMAYNICVVSL